MSGYQFVDDVIGAEHGEEILLFGRALEFLGVDLVSHHQLRLPLFLNDEAAH
jgi:hypothetical protein